MHIIYDECMPFQIVTGYESGQDKIRRKKGKYISEKNNGNALKVPSIFTVSA